MATNKSLQQLRWRISTTAKPMPHIAEFISYAQQNPEQESM